MARRPRPRSRRADRAGPVTAAAQARRLRDRRVLPAEGPHRARAAAERPRRLADVRRLGRRASRSTRRRSLRTPRASRAARSSTSPTSPTRSGSSWSRSFSRSSSPGCADSRARRTCARSSTWTRSSASSRRPPTPPAKKPILTILKQARAFGVGHGARDPEPGRPRLQGDVQRGHVDGRPAADRARQGARPRGPPLGRGRHRRRRRSTRRSAASRSASSCWSARKSSAAGAVRDSLGDVVPARPADEGPDRDADARRAAARRAGGGRTALRRPASCGRVSGRRDARSRPRSRTASRFATSTRQRRGPLRSAPAGQRRLPAFLAARVNLRFDDAKAGLDATEEWEALFGPLDGGLDLDSELRSTTTTATSRSTRRRTPSTSCRRRPLGEPRFFREATTLIQRRLVDRSTLEVQRNPSLKLYSRPGETPEEFAQRCDEAAQAEADRRRRRSATGSRRARTGSRVARRACAAPGRGAGRRRALTPDDRARCRRGCGARRSPARAAQHALDREHDR